MEQCSANGLIYGIPPFDATPTTSVLIISPSTTAVTAVTAAATTAVVDTTTINTRTQQTQARLVGCYTADASGSAAWLWTMAFSCHGIPCNSPSILIVDPAASAVDTTILSVPEVLWCEFHDRDGLGVSMSLFSMVTFIHSHRSSDAFRPHKQEHPPLPSLLALDAMRNHLPKLHNGRGIVLVCACRWFGEERMGREGK
ncbi:hypothetical protein PTSG_10521, partial [Salpingoeca rosetta]